MPQVSHFQLIDQISLILIGRNMPYPLFTFFTLITAFSLSVSQYANFVDYCSPSLCRDGRKNIACGNDGAIDAACASYSEIVPLSEEIKAKIIQRHNEYRNQLALGKIPNFQQAARMATMQWHDELATMADYNVKSCTGGHDRCRNTFNFRHSGQNIAKKTIRDGTLTMDQAENNIIDGIDRWFDENQICPRDMSTVYTTSKKVCAHFTVMITEKNTHLGCAMLHMKNRKTVFTCNYATNNLKEAELYTPGLAASNCTTGVNLEFPGLCSINERY